MSTHQHDHDGHDAPGDAAGGHGMVVLGTDAVFLSHLPMFHGIHAYQVIVEAELTGPDGRPTDDYVEDRKNHPAEQLYTLRPRPFVLPEILPQGSRPPRLTSFRGGVFRNHFERPDTKPEKIVPDVVVAVKNVVHGRLFDPDAPPPQHLEYIIFGVGDDLYLAHLITAPPDFDQLIRVHLNHELTGAELGRGHHVTVPDRANSSSERIQPADGPVSAVLHAGGRQSAVEIEPGAEVYLEEDELRG